MRKSVINDLKPYVNNYLNDKNVKTFNKLINEALSYSDLYFDDFDNFEKGLDYLYYVYKIIKNELIINEKTISKINRLYLNLADLYMNGYQDIDNEKILMELVDILEIYDSYCKDNNIENKHYKTYKKVLTEIVDFIDDEYISSKQKKYIKKYYDILTKNDTKITRANANYLMSLCYHNEKYKILALGLAYEVSDHYYEMMLNNFFDNFGIEYDLEEQIDIWLDKYKRMK